MVVMLALLAGAAIGILTLAILQANRNYQHDEKVIDLLEKWDHRYQESRLDARPMIVEMQEDLLSLLGVQGRC